MKIQIIDRAKKKKMLRELELLGIKKIEHLLVKDGGGNISAYSGTLSVEEIYDLWRLVSVEGIGLSFAREINDKKTGKREIRLSLGGVELLRNQISEKILELNSEQEMKWFFGKNIELTDGQSRSNEIKKSFVVVKSKISGDIIGTGKVDSDCKILYNYLPKDRRRKKFVM